MKHTVLPRLADKVFLMMKIFFALLLTTASVFADTAIQQYLTEGEKAMAAGKFDRALEVFKQAEETGLEAETVQHKLASAYLLKADYRNGVVHFQKLAGLNPENAKAFIGLALCYLHLGQYGLAEAALKEAQQLPNNSQQDIDKLLGWIESRKKAH